MMKNIIRKVGFTALVMTSLSCSEVEKNEAPEEVIVSKEDIRLSEEQFNNLSVELANITQMPFSTEIELNGVVDVPPENIAEVSSAIPGIIKSMTHNVLPGKYVKRGAVLAIAHSMELVQLKQDYLEAYLKSEVLSQEYARQKELMENGAGVLKKMQSAESNVKLNKAQMAGLEAKLKIAHVNMDKLKEGEISPQLYIYAPFSGFVQDVHVNTGTNFKAGDALFELISKEHLHVELSAFQKDAVFLKNKQKVLLNGANLPQDLRGTIFLISKSFDSDSKSINVHVHIDEENKEQQLIPGQFVRGKVQLTERLTNVLPESAIVRESEGHFVYVKKEGENAFEKVAVEVGKSKDDMIAINSPLSLENVAISQVQLISGLADSGD